MEEDSYKQKRLEHPQPTAKKSSEGAQIASMTDEEIKEYYEQAKGHTESSSASGVTLKDRASAIRVFSRWLDNAMDKMEKGTERHTITFTIDGHGTDMNDNDYWTAEVVTTATKRGTIR